MSEIERIKKAYDRRKIKQKNKLYSYFNKANLFVIHQREKRLLETLRRFNFSNLSDKKILDVGCGVEVRCENLSIMEQDLKISMGLIFSQIELKSPDT